MAAVSFKPAALYSATYDDDVLDIFSKIVPRLVLMSSAKNNLKEKIEICVLHDKIDEQIASRLIDRIDSNYPNGIKNYKIKSKRSDYANIGSCRHAQLMFMLDSDDKNIEKTVKYSHSHTIFTIAYDSKYLEKGVGASLFLGRKVTPFINMQAIQKSGIEMDNTLIRISKIYTSEDGL